jgi:hypothetical protein
VRAAAVVLVCGCGRIGFSAQVASDASIDVGPVADPGLIAWYEMESLGSGTIHDSSGHGHDGACTVGQCPEVVAGRIGNGFRFDGVTQNIMVLGDPELDTTSAYTVASWLWIDQDPPETACALNKPQDSGNGDSWQLCLQGDGTVFFGADLANTSLSVPLPTGSWHHIAVRWDGAADTLFVDGQGVAMTPVTTDIFAAASPVTIGVDLDEGMPVAWFAGMLDDVRIYDRALGSDEIASLATM